jgi:hypothetical protein
VSEVFVGGGFGGGDVEALAFVGGESLDGVFDEAGGLVGALFPEGAEGVDDFAEAG